MTRQILFDTETTGLSPKEGHRVIEIGCVELVNRKLTGNNFHYYINPHREVDEESIKIHGLTNRFLANKPSFYHIANEFIEYVRGAELIAHNASFDIGFLDHELGLAAEHIHKQVKISDLAEVIDTLVLAKNLHPGQRNSLDALCKRYGIDNAHRELHGALLDSHLLAEVYLAMTGGQSSMEFFATSDKDTKLVQTNASNQQSSMHDASNQVKVHTDLIVIKANDKELSSHKSFLEYLAKKSESGCLWHGLESN